MTCESIRMPDGGVAIICHGGKRWKRCSVKGCGQVMERLCDYPAGGGKTCDKPLCSAHTIPQGPNVDYCPDHPKQQLAIPLPLNGDPKKAAQSPRHQARGQLSLLLGDPL